MVMYAYSAYQSLLYVLLAVSYALQLKAYMYSTYRIASFRCPFDPLVSP